MKQNSRGSRKPQSGRPSGGKSYPKKDSFKSSRDSKDSQGGFKKYDSFDKKSSRPGREEEGENAPYKKDRFSDDKSFSQNKRFSKPGFKSSRNQDEELEDDSFEMEVVDPNAPIRLNKYIANTGFCSRREADEVIKSGKVTVNGVVITEMGTKIKGSDAVLIDGNEAVSQNKVYILFNKPKDCITTKSDPEGRRTVFDLIEGACPEKVEAVGRLDRNTTGVLLFTNDGELHQLLTHPKYSKMKIYHAHLDKNLGLEDYHKILDGVMIDDEKIIPDDLQYVDGAKNELGIQIHSGKYHIVKRIFEAVGYNVEKLDRVYFAGLTKKNLPRGKWRFLTKKEVGILKQGAYE